MEFEIEKAWTDALESGNYGQVDGQLVDAFRSGDEVHAEGYCCLGVLAEVLCEIRPSLIRRGTGDTDKPISWEWKEGDHWLSVDDGNLPDQLCSTIGLNLYDRECLIQMNDGSGEVPMHEFTEIAAAIKSHDIENHMRVDALYWEEAEPF